MKPLESAEENVRRLTNNNLFILHFPENCETNKSSITKCEKCEIEYCNEECRSLAYTSYHDLLCLEDRSSSHEHPISILYDAWK